MTSYRRLALCGLLVACGPVPQQQQQPRPVVAEGEAGDGEPDGDPDNPGADGIESGEVEGGEAGEPTAPTPPPPPSKPTSGLSAEMQTLLDAHNRVRAQHCAAPLAWSTKLAASAQAWANSLDAQNCAFEHSRTRYGENLAGGTPGAIDPEGTLRMWYDEVKLYDFKRPGFAMDTGHFTQVVWKGTTQLGCGRVSCRNGKMDIWVCQYDPAGNMQGDFPQNVAPRGCK